MAVRVWGRKEVKKGRKQSGNKGVCYQAGHSITRKPSCFPGHMKRVWTDHIEPLCLGLVHQGGR